MGQFKGFFEGAETFLTPKLSWARSKEIQHSLAHGANQIHFTNTAHAMTNGFYIYWQNSV